MKTLREVLGKNAENQTDDTGMWLEIGPTILISDDEFVLVNRGKRGMEFYKITDMDDSEYHLWQEDIDAAVWNPETESWEIVNEGDEPPFIFQVVEKILEYKVIKP